MTAPCYAEVAARSNFSFLDGASHPEELVEQAAALGHAGFGLCDTNGLAGVVRAHGAAKAAGLAFAPGCRLRLEDGAEWLIWPADRAAYGRLTTLLSAARMAAPKDECRLDFAGLCDAAEGQVVAAIPPVAPAALRRLSALRLALPPLIAVACPLLGDDAAQLAHYAALAEEAGARLLATNNIRYHQASRRRLADVLSAIRLRCSVEALGQAAEPNAERHLKSPAEMARLFAGSFALRIPG